MIIHLHGGAGMRIILSEKNGVLSKINKFFIKRLGAVIVLGEKYKHIYSSFLQEEKIFIIPNFSEDFLFMTSDKIIDKFNDVKVIKLLFMSNLIFGKGHEELLDSFLKLPENYK